MKTTYGMADVLRVSACLLLLTAASVAKADDLYAATVNGNSYSVMTFTPSLGALSSTGIPVQPSGLAVGTSGNIYIASANSTYEFNAKGVLLNQITGSPPPKRSTWHSMVRMFMPESTTDRSMP